MDTDPLVQLTSTIDIMSIAHTRVFYTMLMEDDHSALHTAEAGSGEEGQTRQDDPLTALLCPDCRMQNKLV